MTHETNRLLVENYNLLRRVYEKLGITSLSGYDWTCLQNGNASDVESNLTVTELHAIIWHILIIN